MKWSCEREDGSCLPLCQWHSKIIFSQGRIECPEYLYALIKGYIQPPNTDKITIKTEIFKEVLGKIACEKMERLIELANLIPFRRW